MTNSTLTIQFSYDGYLPNSVKRANEMLSIGNRVATTVDGQTTSYVLDVAAPLPEVLVATTSGQSDSYLHAPHLVMQEQDGQVSYPLADGLGSVRSTVDALGQVVVVNMFDPYGNAFPGSSSGDPYGFTGEWWQSEAELLYLRARWYASKTGTFLSRDPIESEPPYLYVRGNPVNYVDPGGYVGLGQSNVCDSWSGPLKVICTRAEAGSLSDMETIYRFGVQWNRLRGWYVAADLLDHYLDGTEGLAAGIVKPGKPYFIYGRKWILQRAHETDNQEYNKLISRFVNEYLRPAAANCSSGPIRAYLPSDYFDSSPDTEAKVSLGNHRIQANFEAWLQGRDIFFADTRVYFVIDDPYDFDPLKGLDIRNEYGVGFIPHRWLVELADAHWAAEFNLYVIWNEHLSISGSTNSIMYKVDRLSPP